MMSTVIMTYDFISWHSFISDFFLSLSLVVFLSSTPLMPGWLTKCCCCCSSSHRCCPFLITLSSLFSTIRKQDEEEEYFGRESNSNNATIRRVSEWWWWREERGRRRKEKVIRNFFGWGGINVEGARERAKKSEWVKRRKNLRRTARSTWKRR